jgi:hypothetical protein
MALDPISIAAIIVGTLGILGMVEKFTAKSFPPVVSRQVRATLTFFIVGQMVLEIKTNKWVNNKFLTMR